MDTGQGCTALGKWPHKMSALGHDIHALWVVNCETNHTDY